MIYKIEYNKLYEQWAILVSDDNHLWETYDLYNSEEEAWLVIRSLRANPSL